MIKCSSNQETDCTQTTNSGSSCQRTDGVSNSNLSAKIQIFSSSANDCPSSCGGTANADCP